MKLIFYVAALFILFKFIVPYLRLTFEKMHIKAALRRLPQPDYKVIQNVSLPEYHVNKFKNGGLVTYSRTEKNLFIDYLIVSKYGLFLIKLLDLKHRHSGLRGREYSEQWTVIRFSRFFLPLIGSALDQYSQVRNPLIEAKLFSVSLRKHVELIDPSIPIHPIVIITPQIKSANLYDNKADVTFYRSLTRMIDQYKKAKIENNVVDELYAEIKRASQSVYNDNLIWKNNVLGKYGEGSGNE